MIATIAKSLIDEIRAERTHYSPNETGGFLIGLRRGPNIEVTEKTIQSQLDVATRSSFDRADPAHRATILKAWAISAKTKCLVGDWHTHPYQTTWASRSDVIAWATLERSCRQPVIGLIDAGEERPRLFAASSQLRSCAVEMYAFEECQDYLVYAADISADAQSAGVTIGRQR